MVTISNHTKYTQIISYMCVCTAGAVCRWFSQFQPGFWSSMGAWLWDRGGKHPQRNWGQQERYNCNIVCPLTSICYIFQWHSVTLSFYLGFWVCLYRTELREGVWYSERVLVNYDALWGSHLHCWDHTQTHTDHLSSCLQGNRPDYPWGKSALLLLVLHGLPDICTIVFPCFFKESLFYRIWQWYFNVSTCGTLQAEFSLFCLKSLIFCFVSLCVLFFIFAESVVVMFCQVMLTREDLVVSVQNPDGSLSIEHADGTRITRLYQDRSPNTPPHILLHSGDPHAMHTHE